MTGVAPAGLSAYCIDVAPAASLPHFNYMPGQFVFLSFDSPAMMREAHPFTIASSPSRPGALGVGKDAFEKIEGFNAD